MAVLPEYVFQRIIVNGIQVLRSNPKIIDQLLWNLPSESVESVKKTLGESPIGVFLQFPRQDTAVPFIVITLQDETESNTYLNDMLGSDMAPPEEFTYTNNPTIETLGGVSINPILEGEPPKIFKETALVERRGSGFTEKYNIEIATADYHFTVFLYTFIKTIFLQNRVRMEHNGIQNLMISGAEMNLKRDYLPDFVFVRSLSLKFLYYFDLYKELEVLSRIDLTAVVLDENTNGFVTHTLVLDPLDP